MLWISSLQDWIRLVSCRKPVVSSLNTLLVFFLIRAISKRTTPALLTALSLASTPCSLNRLPGYRNVRMYFILFSSCYRSFSMLLMSGKKWPVLFYSCFLMFVCSVLSKSTAVLLHLYYCFQTGILNGNSNLKQLTEKIPYLVVSIIIAIVALKSQYSARFTDFCSLSIWLYRQAVSAAIRFIFIFGCFSCLLNYLSFIPIRIKQVFSYRFSITCFNITHYFDDCIYRFLKASDLKSGSRSFLVFRFLWSCCYFSYRLCLCLVFQLLPKDMPTCLILVYSYYFYDNIELYWEIWVIKESE